MQKTFSQLKSIKCKHLFKDVAGDKIPEMEQDYSLLYNESRISLQEVKQKILDDTYKDSPYIFIMDHDTAHNLADKANVSQKDVPKERDASGPPQDCAARLMQSIMETQ